MRLLITALIVLLPAAAQELKMPNFDKLIAKATEVVDVNLDANLLGLAGRFLSDKGDEAKAKKLIGGLKSVYVKSFEFAGPNEYDPADVESLRSQLRPPAWSRIVGVTSKKKGEHTEIFIRNENGRVMGLAIIAAEATELTIVSIVGEIDPAQLSDLGGHFGIPKIDTKDKKDDEE